MAVTRHQKVRNGRYIVRSGAIAVLSLCPAIALATVDSWDIEGENGVLQVTGALSAAACRLDMQSARQEVSMDTTPLSSLKRVGERGTPVAFQLYLRDCMMSGGSQQDRRTAGRVWDQKQPVVTLSFSGNSDMQKPELIQLKGTSGVGLRILDDQNRDIRLGSRGMPLFLSPRNAQLTYYAVPERTSSTLTAGPYQAAADFRLSYE